MSSDPQDSSARGPDDGVRHEAAGPQPTDPRPDESGVLDQVLERTMSDLEAMSAMEARPEGEPTGEGGRKPDDVVFLQDVARRFQGQSWGEETQTQIPIAHALVEATLARRFRHLGGDPDMWRSISETISSSLLEDPNSRIRLQALWTKLRDSLT